MSAKQMGHVYDRVCPAGERDVLLALADHADHDGTHAWCAAGRIAWKLGISVRTAYTRLDRLVQWGVLVPTGDKTEAGITVYAIHLDQLPLKPDYIGKSRITSLRSRIPVKDAKTAPGAKAAPPGAKTAQGGAKNRQGGATPVADKPSSKPSNKPAARLDAVKLAGGFLEFRGKDVTAEWIDAIGDTHLDEVIAILRDERLPNGKRIKLPSGFIAARDRRAAAQRDRVQAKRSARTTADADYAHQLARAADARFITRLAQANRDHLWWARAIDRLAEGSTPDEKKTIRTWFCGTYVASTDWKGDTLLVTVAAKTTVILATVRDRYAVLLRPAIAAEMVDPAVVDVIFNLHQDTP